MLKWTVQACVVCVALAAPALKAAGDADKGKELFEQQCSVCHNADSDEKKMGPGLKGLFKKDKMANGKKPTVENVTAIINEGGNGMPAFGEGTPPIMSKDDVEHVITFLQTL